MKIRPLGAEWFHADRRDMTKLMVGFRNLANAPRNWFHDPFNPVGKWDFFQAVKQMEAWGWPHTFIWRRG